MRALLVLISVTSTLFTIIIFSLIIRIEILSKKLKVADDVNMWHKLAVTDSLTGVYNRNAFDLKIMEIKKDTIKKPRSIIIFDVDNFKVFNDTTGHLAGDEVLKTVGENLMEVFCEPNSMVFRIGGDEFSVLCENVSEKDIIRRLLLLKKRLEAKGIYLSKGYSIIYDNPDKSFKYADEMLYADKFSKKHTNV